MARTHLERCVRSDAKDPANDQKWGRYKTTERLNVDQSPFVV